MVVDVRRAILGHQYGAKFSSQERAALMGQQAGSKQIDSTVQLKSLGKLLARQPGNGTGNKNFGNTVMEFPCAMRIQVGVLERGDGIEVAFRGKFQAITNIVDAAQRARRLEENHPFRLFAFGLEPFEQILQSIDDQSFVGRQVRRAFVNFRTVSAGNGSDFAVVGGNNDAVNLTDLAGHIDGPDQQRLATEKLDVFAYNRL